jgi:hypothetical protein
MLRAKNTWENELRGIKYNNYRHSYIGGLDSAVGIAPRYGLEGHRVGAQVTVGARFSPLHVAQIDSGTQILSYPRQKYVDIYLHSPICLHGIVLKWLSTETTLHLPLTTDIFPWPINPFTSCRYWTQSRKPSSQYLRTSQWSDLKGGSGNSLKKVCNINRKKIKFEKILWYL